MRELCIPIPINIGSDLAEIEVKINKKNRKFLYRLESFPWEVDDHDIRDGITEDLLKIYQLKKTIANYDKDWELIQIYPPVEKAKIIQILFRKKQ
ncbi:hypothetical protein EO244_01705 [Ancylomarina salipaludis]|uniref:Uncharacterized protein n=1 Tax=Ancylomarina salipaludis TaxID=2501299 RepID=A0A4Q1JQA9_9BACT|nr:hypothetical protein [Ancylomarina salipaludis]RXQ97624.1 hypothetical protein EO244_01705 [Ancylomarina salipaludis]